MYYSPHSVSCGHLSYRATLQQWCSFRSVFTSWESMPRSLIKWASKINPQRICLHSHIHLKSGKTILNEYYLGCKANCWNIAVVDSESDTSALNQFLGPTLLPICTEVWLFTLKNSRKDRWERIHRVFFKILWQYSLTSGIVSSNNCPEETAQSAAMESKN